MGLSLHLTRTFLRESLLDVSSILPRSSGATARAVAILPGVLRVLGTIARLRERTKLWLPRVVDIVTALRLLFLSTFLLLRLVRRAILVFLPC